MSSVPKEQLAVDIARHGMKAVSPDPCSSVIGVMDACKTAKGYLDRY